jgi:diadenosine tetraphosphatase ApaH/serine/threonine PP2A family protein phosphatase
VIGGDVFPGPMAHLVLERLSTMESPVDFIYGNGEVAVRECLAAEVPRLVPPSHRPAIEWNARMLSDDARASVAAWPMTLRIETPSMAIVLFCHATPRNENEIFTAETPETKLIPIFQNVGANVVVCGHTHMQFDRMVGRTRVVNAGSVGMPFGSACADWLLLGNDVELATRRMTGNRPPQQLFDRDIPEPRNLQ